MFAEDFHKALSKAPRRVLPPEECHTPTGGICHVCHGFALDYDAEVTAKEAALRVFWERAMGRVPRERLVQSPRGRNYRTVSKRRMARGHLSLLDERGKPVPVQQCAVEPLEHGRIYQVIEQVLPRSGLGPALNYAIVKGSYEEFTLILNVKDLSSQVVRAATPISKAVTKAVPEVTSVFLYEDPVPGDYYMASSFARTHRVWGKSEISIEVHGKRFVYPPVSFSQVNPGIADLLVTWAGDLLALDRRQHFYDLYCGYGLFGLCLADRVEKVTGVEWSKLAVDAAIRNAKQQRVGNARFFSRRIEGDELQRLLRNVRPHDVVLLDPPRNGTTIGVIESIAASRPARVAHVFCNVDIISGELARWRRSGYEPRRAVPFDMFPGTDAIEMMVVLTPL